MQMNKDQQEEPEKNKQKKPPRKISKRNKNGSSSKNSNGSNSDEEEDNSTINCPCEDNTDHGLMIQCEACLVWQHSLCVGIREDKAVPTHYFCERCLPRNFNCICEESTPLGKLIQCSKCATWQHIKCLGKAPRTLPKPYLCPKCSPEYFTYLKQKKSKSNRGRGAKKLREFDFILSPSVREEFEKDFLSYTKSALPDAEVNTSEVDAEGLNFIDKYFLKYCDYEEEKLTAEDLVKALSLVVGRAEQVVEKHVSSYATQILESKIAAYGLSDKDQLYTTWKAIEENVNPIPKSSDPVTTDNVTAATSIPTTLPPVDVMIMEQDCGLTAQQSIEANQFIIEYVGAMSNPKDVDLTKLQPPERRFLTYFNENICIDTRQCGNKSRFIRRSCRPNAELKEINRDANFHVGVFATQKIYLGEEITVGFDTRWKGSFVLFHCCCCSPDCKVVHKLEVRKANARKLLEYIKHREHQRFLEEEKLRRLQSTSPVMDMPLILGPSTPEKMSREERKIALVMKSFQKLENRNNKRRNKVSSKDVKDPKRPKRDQDGKSDEDFVEEDSNDSDSTAKRRPSKEELTTEHKNDKPLPPTPSPKIASPKVALPPPPVLATAGSIISHPISPPSISSPHQKQEKQIKEKSPAPDLHRKVERVSSMEDIATSNNSKILTPTAASSASKFPGRKKAWIMEYEQQQQQQQQEQPQTPSEVNKEPEILPIKKKVLSNSVLSKPDTLSPSSDTGSISPNMEEAGIGSVTTEPSTVVKTEESNGSHSQARKSRWDMMATTTTTSPVNEGADQRVPATRTSADNDSMDTSDDLHQYVSEQHSAYSSALNQRTSPSSTSTSVPYSNAFLQHSRGATRTQ